jgi:DNA-binding transcriptional MerR regulator
MVEFPYGLCNALSDDKDRKMNPGILSKLLGVSSSTICRWSEVYARFLSEDALPAKGQARVFSSRDARVMLFISEQRKEGSDSKSIRQALYEISLNQWRDLPVLPPDWQEHIAENVTVPASLIERLRQQKATQEDVINQQRQMLQMTASSLELAMSQCDMANTEYQSLLRWKQVYRALLIILIIGCAGAILVLELS